MATLPHLDDRERRHRLAVRHAIHPAHRLGTALDAARAMTVLHATEASTVHLSVHARTGLAGPADVDRELYEERSIVKQLAMRRTLFAFPRELLPAALGSASARVATEQRRLLAKDVQAHGIAEDGAAWLATAAAAVLDRLADGTPRTARQLREELPELEGRMSYGAGTKWSGTTSIGPRVLTTLGAEGLLTRAHNEGHWRTTRPTWTLMRTWLGERPDPLPQEVGYAALVTSWLHTYGPGTTEDIQWWLGSTKTAVRAALADVGAVEVSLERGRTGWALADDLEPTPTVEPWAALLPTLDPTTMGWKEREFYLDPARRPYLFDTNGNGGTTAWWDGQIVGAWLQDPDGVVEVVLVPGADPGDEARAALQVQADRLTAWLDGAIITNVYKSALMKGQPLP
ncbi:winged helix DNA-binding domain-containing protein [Ornithinimicrobium panacihumi]|uniref:winged helix DNA-binding domain-containing protein n=1 Tax=Ornithinimicrobium panacihumi TaxID=2008449 RepID=UPI003F895DFF